VLPVTERLGTPLPAPEHDLAPPLPEYLARFLTARLE